MSIQIRIADTADTELIADLSRKTFYETFASQNTEENMKLHMEKYYATEIIKAELNDPDNIFILAYSDDLLAGYAKINDHVKEESRELETPIELERIYSIKEMLGKGVGKKLMETCLAIAKEKNKKEIWLGVWESNFRAVEFYTRWGFKKYADHSFPVGNDPQTDLLMKRSV